MQARRLMAVIVNGVYDVNTVTANYTQFWFCRFRADFFMLKMHLAQADPTSKVSIKITEMIEVDRHV